LSFDGTKKSDSRIGGHAKIVANHPQPRCARIISIEAYVAGDQAAVTGGTDAIGSFLGS
jgi:hypothetical protein